MRSTEAGRARRSLRSRDRPAPLSSIRILAWLAVAAIALMALLGPAPGASGAQPPAGNDGTVKIHEGGTESEPIISNEPHVCTFHVHFFFADPGQEGSWSIESWPPTGDGSTVLSGTYLTDAVGEYRTPASPGTYQLPDGHYRLLWQGRSDANVKHKTFWVECAAPTVPPTEEPTVAPTEEPTSPPTEEPTVVPSGSVEATIEASSSPSGGVEAATSVPNPPATDTTGATPNDGLFRLLLVALAGVLSGVLVLTPATARDGMRR